MASLIHSMGDNLEQMKPYENLVEKFIRNKQEQKSWLTTKKNIF